MAGIQSQKPGFSEFALAGGSFVNVIGPARTLSAVRGCPARGWRQSL